MATCSRESEEAGWGTAAAPGSSCGGEKGMRQYRGAPPHSRDVAFLDAYADLKDPACDLIYLAAEEWARARKWDPGPSDA